MLVAIVRATATAAAEIAVGLVVSRIVRPTTIEVVHTNLLELVRLSRTLLT
jgi:hypothetical protein